MGTDHIKVLIQTVPKRNLINTITKPDGKEKFAWQPATLGRFVRETILTRDIVKKSPIDGLTIDVTARNVVLRCTGPSLLYLQKQKINCVDSVGGRYEFAIGVNQPTLIATATHEQVQNVLEEVYGCNIFYGAFIFRQFVEHLFMSNTGVCAATRIRAASARKN